MLPDQIMNAIIDEWNRMRRPQDTKAIMERSGASTQTIYNAFNKVRCTDKLFKVMQQFYMERKAEIEKAYNDIKTTRHEG